MLDALTEEKVSWFPIFKNKACSGHLEIKTQFIRDDCSVSGSAVFEGGLGKKSEWTVSQIRQGIMFAGLATAAAVGIYHFDFDGAIAGLGDGAHEAVQSINLEEIDYNTLAISFKNADGAFDRDSAISFT
jgi:hypothetical protein